MLYYTFAIKGSRNLSLTDPISPPKTLLTFVIDTNLNARKKTFTTPTHPPAGGPKKDTKGVKNAGVVVPKTVGPASNNDSEPEDVKPNLAELQMQVKRNLEQQIHREISEVAGR